MILFESNSSSENIIFPPGTKLSVALCASFSRETDPDCGCSSMQLLLFFFQISLSTALWREEKGVLSDVGNKDV